MLNKKLLQNLQGAMNSIYKRLKHYNFDGNQLIFAIHDIDDWKLESRLEDKEDKYYIEVSTGIVKYLYISTKFLLSSNEYFPEVGTSAQKIEPTSFGFDDILNESEKADQISFDSERADFHMWLYSRILLFMLYHEHTHIINGHVAYLTANGLKQSKLPAIDSQTLELDADCCAIGELYDDLFYLLEQHPDNINIHLRDKIGIVRILEFILTYYLRYFPAKFKGLPLESEYTLSVKETSHSSPGMRFHFWAGLILERLLNEHNEIFQEARPYIIGSYYLKENAKKNQPTIKEINELYDINIKRTSTGLLYLSRIFSCCNG